VPFVTVPVTVTATSGVLFAFVALSGLLGFGDLSGFVWPGGFAEGDGSAPITGIATAKIATVATPTSKIRRRVEFMAAVSADHLAAAMSADNARIGHPGRCRFACQGKK
jgi:hypothetical protein